MVSHRSGETEDVTIADIVVGIRAGQIVSLSDLLLLIQVRSNSIVENRSSLQIRASGEAQPASTH